MMGDIYAQARWVRTYLGSSWYWSWSNTTAPVWHPKEFPLRNSTWMNSITKTTVMVSTTSIASDSKSQVLCTSFIYLVLCNG
jgi:hypothetical protein